MTKTYSDLTSTDNGFQQLAMTQPDVISPVTEEKIHTVQNASADDVDKAVEAAPKSIHYFFRKPQLMNASNYWKDTRNSTPAAAKNLRTHSPQKVVLHRSRRTVPKLRWVMDIFKAQLRPSKPKPLNKNAESPSLSASQQE